MAKTAKTSDGLKDRLRVLTSELMLIPGLSGYEGRVRRRIATELKALGIASKSDRLGNLIATLPGAKDAPSVMLFAHMDQLGLIVRKIEANGLVEFREDATHGRVGILGPPVKLSATPTALDRLAPVIGEHTDEVLREFGLAADEIGRLRDAGVV